MPRMTLPEIEALMDKYFGSWRQFSEITALGDNDITVRMPFRKDLMRAGGTISGPALLQPQTAVHRRERVVSLSQHPDWYLHGHI